MGKNLSPRTATRKCGVCHRAVTWAVMSGTRSGLEIQRAAEGGGSLAIQPQLPGLTDGDAVRVVAPFVGGGYEPHRCQTATAKAFAAANFNRKRKDPPT